MIIVRNILKHTIQVLENGGKIEHCPQEIATELRLNTYSANILLHYITNLQEENEELKTENEKLTQLWLDSQEKRRKAIEKLESIRIFGLRSGKTLFSTLINESIDILKGDKDE